MLTSIPRAMVHWHAYQYFHVTRYINIVGCDWCILILISSSDKLFPLRSVVVRISYCVSRWFEYTLREIRF